MGTTRRVMAALVAGLAVTVAAALPAVAAPARTPIADWQPLPAAADVVVSDEALALRNELLGEHWDDPDHVTLHWIGVSSFVITIGGHLLLFDAWEIIGAVEDYLPIGREELAGLEPEAVLVGHGHFDHAGDLGYVAGLTGATVVGSEEICTVAQQGAEREGVPTDFPCAITGTADTPAPGVAAAFRLFSDVEPVTVLQHVHSAAAPPGEDNQVDPFVPIMDPQPYIDHLMTNPDELFRFLAQQQESNQGGTWLYHLKDGDFTLVVGNSAGPIFDTPEVGAALDAFPGCVDVLANAILGFDAPVSGLQDPVLYVEATHPRIFIPTHADAWAPVISAGQAQYADELNADIDAAGMAFRPDVDMLLDPQDYLVERAYRVDDPRWAEPVPGSSCAGDATPAPSPEPTTTTEDPATDGGVDGAAGGDTPSTGGGLGVAALVAAGMVAASRRR